jgi:glycerophosphoryl diester phosphodiesterase
MAPSLPTVLLMDRVPVRFRDGSLPLRVGIAGPSLEILRAHPDYVDRVHAAGHRVHVWTVDEPADIAYVLGLGVDAVISNHPRRVVRELRRV